MAWWQKKKTKATPSLPPRGKKSSASKVDVGTLAPTVDDYLSSAATLQLVLSTELAAVASGAWSANDADALLVAAGKAMDRYRSLRALLAEYVPDVSTALAPSREKIARHVARLDTQRWYERVATTYVITGFARDFWHLLAEGLPAEVRVRVRDILADQGDEDIIQGVLQRFLDVDARYLSTMSLWSRRLVGDVMLICREGIAPEASAAKDVENRLEPVFTDVLAHHTRRLDRLGLTS